MSRWAQQYTQVVCAVSGQFGRQMPPDLIGDHAGRVAVTWSESGADDRVGSVKHVTGGNGAVFRRCLPTREMPSGSRRLSLGRPVPIAPP